MFVACFVLLVSLSIRRCAQMCCVVRIWFYLEHEDTNTQVGTRVNFAMRKSRLLNVAGLSSHMVVFVALATGQSKIFFFCMFGSTPVAFRGTQLS